MVKLQILGRSINLLHRSKQQLKGIFIGDSLSYNFYDGEYAGVPLLLLEPKNVNPTPRDCAITSKRLFDLFCGIKSSYKDFFEAKKEEFNGYRKHEVL